MNVELRKSGRRGQAETPSKGGHARKLREELKLGTPELKTPNSETLKLPPRLFATFA